MAKVDQNYQLLLSMMYHCRELQEAVDMAYARNGICWEYKLRTIRNNFLVSNLLDVVHVDLFEVALVVKTDDRKRPAMLVVKPSGNLYQPATVMVSHGLYTFNLVEAGVAKLEGTRENAVLRTKKESTALRELA